MTTTALRGLFNSTTTAWELRDALHGRIMAQWCGQPDQCATLGASVDAACELIARGADKGYLASVLYVQGGKVYDLATPIVVAQLMDQWLDRRLAELASLR